jgi:hypothetical protein
MKLAKFAIAAWAQPCVNWNKEKNAWDDEFKKWQDRQLNCQITGTPEPKTSSMTAKWYCEAAAAHGMGVFMYPTQNPKEDVKLEGFWGWAQPDEPELWNHLLKKKDIPPGTKIEDSFDVPGTIKIYLDNYNRLKSISPNTPIYGNFAGGSIGGASENSRPTNISHFKEWSKGFDIGCNDFYLYNTGRYGRFDNISTSINRLAEWSGKPQMAYVECSNQKIQANGRCPTPGEFRAMVWTAVCANVVGIVYFPQEIGSTINGQRYGGFKVDATPPEIVEEMTKVNSVLNRYSDVLLQPGKKLTLPSPFIGIEKTLNGKTYRFVASMSDQTLTLEGRTYGPYGVHIISDAAPSPDVVEPVPVPTPVPPVVRPPLPQSVAVEQTARGLVITFKDGSRQSFVPK